MRIAIRVDASDQIGTGHFMRCLTLANALQQRGAQTRFVSRHLPEHLRHMLDAKGHEFILLKSSLSDVSSDGLSHAHWLGTTQHADAQDTIQALSDQTWDWLVVDHYALDARWESVVRQTTKRILVIDDLADRMHDCDVLLDQNFYEDMDTRYTSKVPAHCRLLLGPRYALLRDEFRQLRERVNPRTGPVKRILVFFGGVDVDNCTALAIEALANIGSHDLHVDVVIGTQHSHRELIESACADHDFVCHVQTNRMAELMASADLAVGAAGVASWERCCLGLPCIVGAVAQNQIQAAKDLSALGAVKFIGVAQDITMQKLREEVKQALYSDWIKKASLCGLELVDSQGVTRVIEVMGKIMTQDKILEHWNQQATQGERAGSNDLIAKGLEINAISKHIRNGMVVAEFGCGNGTTALELLRKHDIELHCFDISPAMIESARKLAVGAGVGGRIHFEMGDVRDEPSLGRKFDVIYSERMIINLPDWESQARAICYLIGLLNQGGRYLMCENSKVGLDNLNKLRVSAGLEAISPPWHNVYLADDLVASLDMPGVKLVDVDFFSATYYFLSRVVNAWLAAKEGKPPSYDALVNQLAFNLPPFGDCAQGKLWVFERAHA